MIVVLKYITSVVSLLVSVSSNTNEQKQEIIIFAKDTKDKLISNNLGCKVKLSSVQFHKPVLNLSILR